MFMWIFRILVAFLLFMFITTIWHRVNGQELQIEELLPQEDLSFPMGSTPVEQPPQVRTFSIDELKGTREGQNMPRQTQQPAQLQLEQQMPSLATQGVSPSVPIEEMPAHMTFPSDAELAKVIELNADELAAFGLYTLESGGFDRDMWDGVSVKSASRFLTTVGQQGLKSRAMRDVIVKAMLTQAVPPADSESDDVSWFARRADVLHRLGEVDAVASLLSEAGVGVTNVSKYSGVDRVWFENALMVGDFADACDFVRQQILNSGQSYWRRGLLTCQLLQKDMRGLELSLNLVPDDVQAADPLFFQLVGAAMKGRPGPRLAPNQVFNPLQAVLYVNYPHLLQPDVILRLPDALLRHVVKNTQLPISLRLQAAEKLVNDHMKAIDIAALGRLYDVIEFDEGVVGSPGVVDVANEETDGSMARALMWQSAQKSGLKSTRALVLKGLWERAEKDGLMHLPAALTPDLRGLRPEANLAWFSPYVIRSALKSGNVETAQAWWKTLKENQSLSRDLVEKRVDLAVSIALLSGEVEEETLRNWLESRDLTQEAARVEAERTLTLLEATNVPVASDIWLTLHDAAADVYTDQGKGPGPLWLRLLGTALEQNKTGQAVLLLAEPLLHAGPSTMAPQGVGNIVTGLRFLTLDEAATHLALEAVIAHAAPAS